MMTEKAHPPGTHIGPFEVVSQRPAGDVSMAYLCFDRQNPRLVVLQTLKPEYGSDREAVDSLAQIGAVWADLGAHPHIVRCHEVLRPENTTEVYLVLDLVVWEKDRHDASLRSWLTPGQPLPVLQVLLCALQIARGMRHVSGKIPGFVHGDLKPENVLVGAGQLPRLAVNRLRVTNLGLASVLEAADPSAAPSAVDEPLSHTRLVGRIAGTPLYLAPERWRGEAATFATDVYALGCMIREMLTGRQAVPGQDVEALRRAHCAGDARSLPSSLPLSIDALVAHCMALEPEKRYESWEAVETAIATAYERIVGFPVPAGQSTDALSESERTAVGWFYNSIGCLCIEMAKAETAANCFELAMRVGRDERDRGLVGVATDNVGEIHRRLGDAHSAIVHHEQALAIARETVDLQAEGAALVHLGNDYLQLGDPRQATQYHDRALAIARQIGDHQGESAALIGMGNVYHQLGDFDRAIQSYEQAHKIAREIGSRPGEASALANLGAIHADLGDYRRAIERQEQSLAIKLELRDRYALFPSLNNLGNVYRDLGQAAQALEYYNRALDIAREIRDRRSEAFAINNMGSTFSNMGDMQRSIEHHQQALAIFREIGDKRNVGDCLTNMGYVYMSLHDTERAIEVSEQALEIDREIGDMRGLAFDSFNMANLLAQQSRFSEALLYAEAAARTVERVGPPERMRQARQLVDEIRAEIRAMEHRRRTR